MSEKRYVPTISVADTKPEPREDWINPISMSLLQAAVKTRKNTVTFGGRLYNLTYGHMFTSQILGSEYECVKIMRADGGSVPMGYVSIDKIIRFQFEDAS